MNTAEAITLLKQAATMIPCDFEARVKLITAIQTVEAALAPPAPEDAKKP